MRMVRNGVTIDFTYINGIPATISFNGMTFYYVVNGQGDITGIVDSTGKVQLRYYYDAWGVSTSVYSDDAVYGLTLATINPLRYRGYVFDWEVGLYYLQSRYYIPEIGRFLNADAFISTGQGMLSSNMFAYCANNPVKYLDPSGYGFVAWLANAAVSAAVNVATSFVAAKVTGQEYTWADAGVAALCGVLNSIPGIGMYLNGALSGGYAAYSAYTNGASLGEAAFCGVVSGVCSIAGLSNLANSQGKAMLSVGVSAMCDLTFGTGNNIISAATSKAVIDNANNPVETTTNATANQVINNSAITTAKQTTTLANTRVVNGKLVVFASKNCQYVDPNDRNKVYCYVQF